MDESQKSGSTHVEGHYIKNELASSDSMRVEQIQRVPQPSADPNDPLNWSSTEKNLTLALVAVMVFNGAFDAASPAAGFIEQAEDFGVPVPSMLDSVGTQTIMLGVGGFLFVPLSDRFGRKPMYIAAAVIAMLGSLGCSLATSLGGFIAGRAINGFGCSGPMALAGLTVQDMFFQHERGQKMGVWTLFFGLSPWLAVLFDGCITTYAYWRWMQWLTFFLWAVLTFLCLFIPETLYHRQLEMQQIPSKHSFWERAKFKKFDGTLTLKAFYRPLLSAWYPSIVFPILYYGNAYGFGVFGSLGILPFAFGQGYGFDAVKQGLVTMALLAGTLCGEPMAGPFSDWVVNRHAKRNGGQRCPEHRLRAIWLGVALLPIGLVIIGCTVHYHTPLIGPCIGMFVVSFAVQIISTIAFTYAVDCYYYIAGDVSLLYNFGRQLFCFYVAFYIHTYVTKAGYAWAFGIYAMISVVLCLPIVVLNVYGAQIRSRLGHTARAEL